MTIGQVYVLVSVLACIGAARVTIVTWRIVKRALKITDKADRPTTQPTKGTPC